jgi:adenylate cyclase class 2
MTTETEAKLKLDSHEEIRARLSAAGASFVGEQLHTDTYFDDVERSLTKSDKCLRLRTSSEGGRERFYLTYKGPKQTDDYKKRQEIEAEVKDADAVERLLVVLGYEKTLAIEKRRELWRLGGCEVSLDEVPRLGRFVEIEGPDSVSIADVQRALDLGDRSHIQQSYAALMAEKQGGARPGVKL